MRLKVILPVLGLSLATLLAVFCLRPRHPQSQTDSPPPTQVAGPANPDFEPVSASRDTNHSTQPATSEADSGTIPETPADFAARRSDELLALAMTGDLNSLCAILAELNNRDPQIRAAAVSAAVQFGSTEAIPALRDAYVQVDDPKEKIQIKQAIEFLSLPPAAEASTSPP